jgi:hypothetical protein
MIWKTDYNLVRPHSAIGNLAPSIYAELSAPRKAAGRGAALHRGSALRPVAPPSQQGSNVVRTESRGSGHRYNALLYVRADAIPKLSDTVAATRIPDGVKIHDLSPLHWRLRRAALRLLPTGTITKLAAPLLRYSLMARQPPRLCSPPRGRPAVF